MLLHGAPKKMLIESEILAAQSISKSEAEAARKLGVSYMTYKKYAELYGLYGRVINMAGKGIKKPVQDENSGKYPIDQVLEGKFPTYSTNRLKVRLIRSGRIETKCAKCGFSEKRVCDNESPLLLNYIDGNNLNKKRENLELLCYNCYFLNVNNPFGHKKEFKVTNTYDGEKQEKTRNA